LVQIQRDPIITTFVRRWCRIRLSPPRLYRRPGLL